MKTQIINILISLTVIPLFSCQSSSNSDDECSARINRKRNSIQLKNADSPQIQNDTCNFSLTAEEAKYQFIALIAPDYVHDDFSQVLVDSTILRLKTTFACVKYFHVLVFLNDSVIKEVSLKFWPIKVPDGLETEIVNQLIGHKPKYDFIDNPKYGTYDFLINVDKLK